MYRDDMRDFLKGDYWKAPDAARRITGSTDLYNPFERGADVSVNFITCHDGFTLNDLYSYNEKHNLENGWNNTDGADDNRSWNCGVEGPTTNRKINKLRLKLMRNAFAVLMCSRGTPMFLSGDEFCDTRMGNNNPYCQDNPISWLDWSLLKKNADMFEFAKYMIHFRHKHAVIRKDITQAKCGFPHVSQHENTPWDDNFTSDSKVVCTMFAGYDETTQKDDIVYMAINSYWEPEEIQLPNLPEGMNWYLAADTATGKNKIYTYEEAKMPVAGFHYTLKDRSVAIFVAK